MSVPYTKPHQQGDPDAVQEIAEGTWSFKPKAFNIVWGGDPRYWLVPKKETDDAAELVQVSWLEVTASTTKNLRPGKSYELSFEVSMSQGAFGWKDCPVSVMAKVGKSARYKRKRIKLHGLEGNADGITTVPGPNDRFIVNVPDAGGADCKLYFGLYEIWTGRWKGGLRIHKALVKETNNK